LLRFSSSSPALTFLSGVGSIGSLFVEGSKGEGGERACVVRKNGAQGVLAIARTH
jgi:hypothetical protein